MGTPGNFVGLEQAYHMLANRAMPTASVMHSPALLYGAGSGDLERGDQIRVVTAYNLDAGQKRDYLGRRVRGE